MEFLLAGTHIVTVDQKLTDSTGATFFPSHLNYNQALFWDEKVVVSSPVVVGEPQPLQ
jgi:hypothetical protein